MKLLLPLLLMMACTSAKLDSDLLIENALLFDGVEFKDEADIYVRAGVIQKITYGQSRLAGTHEQIIDGKGKTIIPGLINAHVHVQESGGLIRSAQAGVLTVLDLLKIPEDSISHYKALGERPQYAYYYTAGIGADMPEAVIQFFTGEKNRYAPQSLSEVQQFVDSRVSNGVDFIKIFQDSRLKETFPDSLFDALIETTHQRELVATVHAQTLADARYVVDRGADVLAHIWNDSALAEADLKRWSKRNLHISPTLLVSHKIIDLYAPAGQLSKEELSLELMKLHRSGIKILAGTDAPNAGINFGSDLIEEMLLYSTAGMSTTDVLKTATSNPAEAYNLKRRGFIKENGSADFLLIRGDLQEDIHTLRNLESIWKSGVNIR